jgi:myo-inositol-1(or 4)-monophosphatase
MQVRIPYVAVSIAIAIQGTVVVGVVHNPITSDTYVATLGGGAFKNGKRISTSSTTSLEESLVSFGFGYDKHDLSNQLSSLESVMSECRGVRRFGAASLDLCMVAEGTLDIYYETSVRSWDYAAGSLILSEAGGAVSNLDGAAFSLGTSQIAVAANKELLSKFLKLF